MTKTEHIQKLEAKLVELDKLYDKTLGDCHKWEQEYLRAKQDVGHAKSCMEGALERQIKFEKEIEETKELIELLCKNT